MESGLVNILERFCGGGGIDVETPWSFEGHTYVSDGFMCVRVKGEIFSPSNCIPNIATLYGWHLLGSPLRFRIRGIPEPGEKVRCRMCSLGGVQKACEECAGKGEVTFSNVFNEYEVECKRCGGKGFFGKYDTPACPFCLGSRWERGWEWKIGSAYYDIRRIGKIVSVLGETTFFVAANDPGVAAFRWWGGEGLLVPMFCSELRSESNVVNGFYHSREHNDMPGAAA